MMDKKILIQVPKIDLHCHLSGSIRPRTILDIALKEGIDIPTSKKEEIKNFVQVSEDCKSLKEYLTKFDLTLSVMQKPEHLYRITYELLEDLSKQNVKYVEIRVAPYLHMEQGMTFSEVVENVLKAIKDGRSEYGVYSNLILICMRHHNADISLEVVKNGGKFLGQGVVAIDLAGNEQDFPPEVHEEAFKLAVEYGYHRTVHAGETGIPKNIITSVRELHAERIGHGVHAYMDEEVLNFININQVPLEMCISSNVQTGAVQNYKSHPMKKYLDMGIKVTVNSDNSTISNTTLTEEYEKLFKFQEFDYNDLVKVINNGIDASFTVNEEKEELKTIFKNEFKILGLNEG